MAILDKDIVKNDGMIKEIDQDSLDMIIDMVQINLYKYPEDSAIREIFSNMFDAIAEKQSAIKIKCGEAKVSDYYIEDDRKETKTSKFNPDYYDLFWLDHSNNKATIEYVDEADNGKDMIYFSDYGVGMDVKRLTGAMMIGYSTKRLSNNMIGKFGAGAKSALATNIDFYVLESWYNGFYTKVMVYDHFFKCIIPKEESDKEDIIYGRKYKIIDGEKVIVESNDSIHWKKTDRKNGVTVSFHVKTHNKPKYIEGVKRQLMYFGDYLTVYDVDATGFRRIVEFASITLLDTPLFKIVKGIINVPHILINNVNYGVIDFAEIGMNKKFGSVAIKATPQSVNVMANRESIKWDDKVRDFITTVSEEAGKQAGEILHSELNKIENPIERYFAANKFNFYGSSDKEYLLNTLKAFSGDVNIPFNIDYKKYLTPQQILKFKGNKAPHINDFNGLIMRIKASIINYQGNRFTTSDSVTLRDMDFSKTWFKVYEDKAETLRTSEGLYIFNKCGVEEKSNSAVSSIFYLSLSETNEPPMDQKTYYDSLGDDEEKKLKQKIANSDSPDLVEKAEEVLEKLKQQKKDMYSSYIRKHRTAIFTKAVFIGILKEFANDFGKVKDEDIKAYAKEVKLVQDSALTTKKDVMNTHYVTTLSVQEIRKNEMAELKKSKQVIPVRVIGKGATNSPEKEEYYRIFLEDLKVSDIAALKERLDEEESNDRNPTILPLIFGSTEEKETVKFVRMLVSHCGYTKTSVPYNNSDIRILETVNFRFITVAKDNKKIISQIPGAIDVKEYILNKKIEGKKMEITFQKPLRDFMTCVRLLGLIKEYPMLTFIRYGSLVNTSMSSIPFVSQAFDLLDHFPVRVTLNEDRTISEDLMSSFGGPTSPQAALMLNFLKSVESLLELQNLPWIELNAAQQKLVSQYEEYKVDLYDKELCENLVVEVAKNRETIEKIILRICAKSELTSDVYDVISKSPLLELPKPKEVIEDTEDAEYSEEMKEQEVEEND